MPLDAKRPGFTRKTLRYRKSLTSAKSKRPATLLIAVIAVVAVAAFSVTVSRSAGWLWKSQPQPSAPSSSNSKPEAVKTLTSAPAAAVDSHRPLGPNAALLTPTEVRRLIAMRNWRPENERAEVDAVIRKARAAGIDCASWEAGSIEAIDANVLQWASPMFAFQAVVRLG